MAGEGGKFLEVKEGSTKLTLAERNTSELTDAKGTRWTTRSSGVVATIVSAAAPGRMLQEVSAIWCDILKSYVVPN